MPTHQHICTVTQMYCTHSYSNNPFSRFTEIEYRASNSEERFGVTSAQLSNGALKLNALGSKLYKFLNYVLQSTRFIDN